MAHEKDRDSREFVFSIGFVFHIATVFISPTAAAGRKIKAVQNRKLGPSQDLFVFLTGPDLALPELFARFSRTARSQAARANLRNQWQKFSQPCGGVSSGTRRFSIAGE